jgi:hypothetical protein
MRLLDETREAAAAHPFRWFMIEAIRRRAGRRARSLELRQAAPPPREHDLDHASREQWLASVVGIVFARIVWATFAGVTVFMALAITIRLILPALALH